VTARVARRSVLQAPATQGRPPFKNEVVQRWTAAIAQSDGFVFVTPEYNYGPSAVLKNAIDWVYPEWNPRGTDPAIVFGRYCRRHNRPSLSAKRPIQQSGSSMILRRCESPGDTARIAARRIRRRPRLSDVHI
jgi:NAD(P)H-dependent FMN reductase